MKIVALFALFLALAACGVDGPPVPPGQDNPRTVDPEELREGGLF